jgi:hypothetical protein
MRINLYVYLFNFLIINKYLNFAFAQCSIGSYLNSQNVCRYCPNGSYCPNGVSAIPCPLGSYSSNGGGITECKKCPLGFYANVIASTGCKVCPNGYYCCNPTILPIPCPVGTYSSTVFILLVKHVGTFILKVPTCFTNKINTVVLEE